MNVLVLVCSLVAQAAGPAPALETRVREIIAASGAEVAVAFRTLDGRSELLIDPDKPFHAASTMKLPAISTSAAMVSHASVGSGHDSG